MRRAGRLGIGLLAIAVMAGCRRDPPDDASLIGKSVPSENVIRRAAAPGSISPEPIPSTVSRACWPELDRAASGGAPEIWLLASAANVADLTRTGTDLDRFVAWAARELAGHPLHVCALPQATRPELAQAFARLQRVGARDLVVFYFSGHGAKVPDDANQDEARWLGADPLEEIFVTADFDPADPLRVAPLRDDDFAAWVAALPTDQFVAVLDACFSADMPRAEPVAGLRPKFLPLFGFGDPDRLMPLHVGAIDPVKGLVLSAAGGVERAFEAVAQGGVFTAAIVAGDPDTDPETWFRGVRERVRARSDDRQTPRAAGDWGIWRRWFGAARIDRRGARGGGSGTP